MNRMTSFLPRTPRRRSRAFFWIPAGFAAASAAAGAALWWTRTQREPMPERLVRDVMIGDVVTVDAGATLLDAAVMMRDHNVGVLPVVENDRLRGIITDRDLVVRAMAEGAVPSMTKVGECATWDIVCARADSSLDEVREVMADSQIGRIPVVDVDNRVIGILTLSSLALRADTPHRGDALETAQEVSKRSSRAA